MSDVISPTDNQTSETVDETAVPTISRSRKIMRAVGIVLIGLSVLLGWYLLIGYLGWQSGQEALVEERAIEEANILARQISLARENIDQDSFNLALRRLEYVLERDPNNREALDLQDQAQTALAALITPQAQLVATNTPTPEPLPTATPGVISDPQKELQRIRRLAANHSWEEGLSSLLAFQRQFPNYERQETDKLLYDAYINYGLTLLEGEQVELGLFYLEQAEKLGDLSQELLDYRLWAELYLQGIAFYGVNWDVATYYFRELCLSAPFYQSSCERLRESLVNLADQYAGSLDWCPAEPLYQEALQYERTQAVVTKLSQAQEACLSATPTPLAPITDTLPVTGTDSLPDAPFILWTPTAAAGSNR